jgi:hypothetical protein
VTDASATVDSLFEPGRAFQLVEALAALGPRLPGTTALERFEEALAAGFAGAGLQVDLEPYALQSWNPIDVALSIACSAGPEDLAVSSCYPESGSTPENGVSARLVHLGEVSRADFTNDDVKGRIALVDYPLRTRRLDDEPIWDVYDPDKTSGSVQLLSHAAQGELEKLRRRIAAAGGAGMIVGAMGVAEEEVHGRYQPVFPPSVQKYFARNAGPSNSPANHSQHANLPALWVGPSVRNLLVEASSASVSVTIRLRIESRRVAARTVLATLPGKLDEAIVLVTHTDGINAVQENAAAIFVAMAEALGKIPRVNRQRTVMFACVTGHFARHAFEPGGITPTLAESEGLLLRRPDIIRRAVVAIGVEHLGATEWVEQGGAFVPTGRNEWTHCATSNHKLAEIIRASLEGTSCGPVVLVNGRIRGIPYPFHEEGIPTASYGASPRYLMSEAADAHLSKISPERVDAELLMLLRTVRALDTVSLASDSSDES